MAIFNSYVELPEGIYKWTSSITCLDLRGKTLTADVVNWADDMLQFFSTPDTSRQIQNKQSHVIIAYAQFMHSRGVNAMTIYL